ncbi:hypothetical protein AFUB_057000 [Aspergillus fumigatus A1163]|uniref:Uncharacterized protein n=1 Tax=Aspergillus fumigatus (strain CBS 144.89 / FGSC A1163 / CEA10) TaxID=451804 RepID=B0Y498_ASPFC|nr:hypothetical protein AFUB_057000 [Aspergillus fumigatus A1163]
MRQKCRVSSRVMVSCATTQSCADNASTAVADTNSLGCFPDGTTSADVWCWSDRDCSSSSAAPKRPCHVVVVVVVATPVAKVQLSSCLNVGDAHIDLPHDWAAAFVTLDKLQNDDPYSFKFETARFGCECVSGIVNETPRSCDKPRGKE